MSFRRRIRNGLATLVRSVPFKGRWRLTPLLGSLFPDDRTLVRLPGVGRVSLDLGDEDQRQMFWTGLHPDDVAIIRLVQATLPPDGVFLDIGANIGLHTLAAARRLQSGGRVLGFEPHPENYRALRENIERNELRGVTVEPLGLAEAPAFLRCQGAARGGNWSLASRGDHAFDVRLVRLDDYLEDSPLPRLDMIKVDVEGAESRVLQGAARTIRRFRPVIIFEVCPSWLGRLGTGTGELFALLEGYGYHAHALPRRGTAWGPRLRAEELAHLGPNDWTNLVAVPVTATVPAPAASTVEPAIAIP